MKKLTVLLLLALGTACGGGKEVPVVQVRKDSIVESFTEPARTRLEVRHRISMPVTGDVARIELKPGDPVKKGDLLFRIDLVPFETALREAEGTLGMLNAQRALLEDNSVEEAELAYAESSAMGTRAGFQWESMRQEELKLRAARLATELRRMEALRGENAVPERDLDDARLASETANIAVQQGSAELERQRALMDSAEARVLTIRARMERESIEAKALDAEIARAAALRDRALHELELAKVESPVDGIVLERFEIGGGPLQAGTPVMLVGTLEELEVEADVLTQDAYRLQVGAPVEYVAASGLAPLRGTVTRIDPAGFTKFSSLGVEQQRVLVISTLEERPQNLGLGFRLVARYTKGNKDGALVVPRSAIMEDPNGTRYVFRVTGGRLERVDVELGLRGDFDVEVIKGLSEGDSIVQAPDSKTRAGLKL